jgi:Fe-S cluster assembly ATP-binding protein
MSALLEIKDLHVNTEGKEILSGLSLVINEGEIHALMGPNGSGKSTLAQTIAGNPALAITEGEIKFRGKILNKLSPDKRARLGLFLAFQYPSSVPGVNLLDLLRSAINVRRPDGKKVHLLKMPTEIKESLTSLKISEDLLRRPINEGFSGGEKKRAEILQMAVLKPELAIMDETDSGLDIDALKDIAQQVISIKDKKQGILIITHYQRILNYIKPDFVHVLSEGRIVRSGDDKLARELEEKGYNWLIK